MPNDLDQLAAETANRTCWQPDADAPDTVAYVDADGNTAKVTAHEGSFVASYTRFDNTRGTKVHSTAFAAVAWAEYHADPRR